MTYADVNGVSLWFEEFGEGAPLVLLHGGFWTIPVFGELLPALATRRKVVAVELQGHGHTGDVERPLAYETLADDVAGLVMRRFDAPVDIVGYSLGAGTATRAVIQHPELFRNLVVVSTVAKSAGWYPEVREGMAQLDAEAMRMSPLYQQYNQVAPRPEDWPVLVAKMREMLQRDYDWSREIAGIRARTMLVFADADSMPVTHIAEFYGLFGGGQRDARWDGALRAEARLAVLPGRTHYDIMAAPELPALVDEFLA
ncbi:alpha/beta hydrolase [Dactylosporangium sp. AC04546]|uniref:alpha/beta fold hydrolase n=1 Tax=Dactylosporangium sp. AC04546 TaxID=2862460 RepID=UPI001EE0605C|nr:alpha/beta hydrolase [Dactylosporangium sp. AC04546]WVK87731.1 alpha/beta hydrolase [Dactylosporangium sp. AC04546]